MTTLHFFKTFFTLQLESNTVHIFNKLLAKLFYKKNTALYMILHRIIIVFLFFYVKIYISFLLSEKNSISCLDNPCFPSLTALPIYATFKAYEVLFYEISSIPDFNSTRTRCYIIRRTSYFDKCLQ